MKQVYGIVLSARLQLGKQALWVGLVNSGEEALASALEQTKRVYGDLAWVPTLTTSMQLTEQLVGLEAKTEEVRDKNWVMATIIQNKDESLLAAMDGYLSEPEKLFIKDKISA